MAGRNLFAADIAPRAGRNLFAVAPEPEPSPQVQPPQPVELPAAAPTPVPTVAPTSVPQDYQEPQEKPFFQPQEPREIDIAGISPIGRAVSAFREEEGRPIQEIVPEAIQAIPESALEFGKAITYPIRHPVETFESMKSLTKGLYQKTTPGVQPDEEAVDALAQFFSDRYGTEAAFKETIAKDPIGVASDLAAALTGGGAALKAAGKLGMAGETAEVANALQKAGAVIEPLNMVKQGTLAIPAKLMSKKIPEELYASAAKMSTTIPPAERSKIVSTALEYELMPTYGGVTKVQGMLDDIGTELSNIIDAGAQAGGTIEVDKILSRLEDARKLAKSSYMPETALKSISRMEDQLKRMHGNIIGVSQAQALKTRIYQEINSAYGKNNLPIAKDAAKAVARGAKEELEILYPELKELNQRYGKLAELQKHLARASSRIKNRDLIGIGTPIKGLAGGAATGSPFGAIGGLAIGVLLDNPKIKARIAIELNRAKRLGIPVSPAGAKAAGFQLGREAKESR